jgi:DNA-binding transcriptional MerR regulator/DNA gyrase inhibitor GyrI
MAREPLMPIGRFARCTRLTVKALRHYDEEGLLRPAYVDLASGDRYYTRGQARDALVIGMLRELGVGLPAVRAILAADDAGRARLLAAEAARARSALTRQQQALRAIERLARADSLLPCEIALRDEPARLMARRSATTDTEHLVPDTTALVLALFGELRAAGRAPRDPVLCMNGEPDADERLVVHACAAVAPPPPRLPTAVIEELAGGTFACLTHRGPYEELGLAYHALFAWAQEHGHDARGLVREVYLNDPAEVAAEDLVTELLLPL